jgi:hypothetical protein
MMASTGVAVALTRVALEAPSGRVSAAAQVGARARSRAAPVQRRFLIAYPGEGVDEHRAF